MMERFLAGPNVDAGEQLQAFDYHENVVIALFAEALNLADELRMICKQAVEVRTTLTPKPFSEACSAFVDDAISPQDGDDKGELSVQNERIVTASEHLASPESEPGLEKKLVQNYERIKQRLIGCRSDVFLHCERLEAIGLVKAELAANLTKKIGWIKLWFGSTHFFERSLQEQDEHGMGIPPALAPGAVEWILAKNETDLTRQVHGRRVAKVHPPDTALQAHYVTFVGILKCSDVCNPLAIQSLSQAPISGDCLRKIFDNFEKSAEKKESAASFTIVRVQNLKTAYKNQCSVFLDVFLRCSPYFPLEETLSIYEGRDWSLFEGQGLSQLTYIHLNMALAYAKRHRWNLAADCYLKAAIGSRDLPVQCVAMTTRGILQSGLCRLFHHLTLLPSSLTTSSPSSSHLHPHQLLQTVKELTVVRNLLFGTGIDLEWDECRRVGVHYVCRIFTELTQTTPTVPRTIDSFVDWIQPLLCILDVPPMFVKTLGSASDAVQTTTSNTSTTELFITLKHFDWYSMVFGGLQRMWLAATAPTFMTTIPSKPIN